MKVTFLLDSTAALATVVFLGYGSYSVAPSGRSIDVGAVNIQIPADDTRAVFPRCGEGRNRAVTDPNTELVSATAHNVSTCVTTPNASARHSEVARFHSVSRLLK